MLVLSSLGYSLLMHVPHSTVKLESQEECCILVAKMPLMMEHKEGGLLLELEKDMWQVTSALGV